MIFIDNFKQCYTVDFRPTVSKYICPACHNERKKKKEKSLYINRQNLIGKCYNCDRTFFKHNEADNIVKEYKTPKELKSTLSKSVIEYFAGRGISEASLNYLKVTNGLTFMPQVNKDVNTIDFNYYKDDKIINIKHRDKDKNFKFETDCEVTFYNFNAIYENKKVIITEGEIDALSFVEVGLFNVVSLPNGCKNTKFIDQYIFDIERVQEWVLCLDKDEGGLQARADLIGKLGIEKCSIINTKDCKDANSFLKKHGKKELYTSYIQAEKIIESEESFDFDNVLTESLIEVNTEVKNREIILAQNKEGRTIEMLTAGNISMIMGKAKSRKTFASMFMISFIIEPDYNYTSNYSKGIVLFDTEQFRDHSVRFIRRLNKIVPVNGFKMFNLRAYKKSDRLSFIKQYIDKYTPTLAIIDNIRDCIKNFNDIEQADDILTELTNLSETTGTCILCTLHQNKNDKNARGHLGTELTIKSESVFGIETDADGTTKITPEYCRNEQFDDITFTVVNGIPYRDETKIFNNDNNKDAPF